AALLLTAMPVAALAEIPGNALVERVAPDRLKISWANNGGVDVYMADKADALPDDAMLVSGNDRDGKHELTVTAGERSYFLLRDHKDGKSVRVAERLLPLEQGSNFRDIGGYPAADGRH